jgi:hypothetical protein
MHAIEAVRTVTIRAAFFSTNEVAARIIAPITPDILTNTTCPRRAAIETE